MKRVLAVMGSPRKNMNTDKLLDKVLEGVRINSVDAKKVYLRDLNISPCISCGNCERTGDCFMNDDMKELYDDFNNSDIIIIASPLYFNTVSSLTKMMIDRCQVYWASKYVLKNPSIDINKKRSGMFICVGGAPRREDQFSACIPVMDLFFKAINTEYLENLFVSNTDEIPVWDRYDIMKLAFEKGKELSF